MWRFRGLIVSQAQLEAFLVSALIASGSLLLSVFGNLYSIYAAYMREGSAPICHILRRLCYCLAFVIILVTLNAIYIIFLLYSSLVELAVWIPYSLALIMLIIALPPVWICREMHNDARP